MKMLMMIILFCILIYPAMATEDIVIEDFENSRFIKWKAEGSAFGDGPVDRTLEEQDEVTGYKGKRYVNSYHGGDDATGTLTSPEFTIQRDYINFLIGGGGFIDKTCVNLILDDEVVRTASTPLTGDDETEFLDAQSWDVRDLRGKMVRIQIIDNSSVEWGHVLVDHIVQSDTKIEIIEKITRQILFEKKYLNLPVKNGAPLRLIHVLIDDQIVREFEISLASGEPDFWVYLELKDIKGKNAAIRVDKMYSGEQAGFDAIYQDDTFPGEDQLYKEKHRPQFHFSSKRGWNNDPNGMMFYGGEYHLFYQHNPFGWPWGNMTWGHAVSKDMIHWEELGDALHPDEWGTMFSGSGVVDWNNTTGFQTGEEPPLICIYTNAGDVNPWSRGKPFTQGIAYSNDRGRTWTKFEGNPVQGHLNDGNRDPKVIWWEETKEWVIVLYLKDDRMAFFRSKDLKRWEIQTILPSFHECPELFQLPVDGDENNKKWILYGASGDYFIGDFDGSQYTPEGEAIRYNYGNAFYASQTFSDIPQEDGRRIQIGWATIETPGMPFNQMMNFPVELTLRTTRSGLRMCAKPVKEIEKLYSKKHAIKKDKIDPGNNPLSEVSGELFDIDAEFLPGDAKEVIIEISGVPVIYNVSENIISCYEEKSPCIPINGKVQLRLLVDRTFIEIFINQGEFYMPMGSIPADNNRSLKFVTTGGSVRNVKLEVNELNSIWP